jgi:probable rRNA maturation factor
LRRLRAAAEFFAGRSAARSSLAFREVAVILQDDAGSDEAHRAIMDVAGATDVITQRYDAMPGEEPGVYGELYVNVERARSAAPARKGWSAEKELLLYVAHGMDHLSGEDDMDDAGRMRMRRRELKWLREFGG